MKVTQSCLTLGDPMDCIMGNGNPPQCSCLENPRDGGAWWAAIYGVAQSQTWLKQLSSSSKLLFSSTYFRVLQLNYTWTVYHPLNSLGKNTEVGSLSLLQGIFPTQGSNPGLLHCRQILYQLSHQGSPRILGWVAYPFSSRFPNPGIKLGSSALQVDSLPSWLPGKPKKLSNMTIISNLIVVTLWSM